MMRRSRYWKAKLSSRVADYVRRLDAGSWVLSFFPYGSKWRSWHKAFYSYLQPAVVHRYHPVQVKANRQLLCNLLETPQEFLKHLRQCVIRPLGSSDVPE